LGLEWSCWEFRYTCWHFGVSDALNSSTLF
jgi:hypothetical protein